MPPPSAPSQEEAAVATAGAVAAVAAAVPMETDALAGNDSLDSGASTKPDVELKPDDVLEA